MVKKQERYTLLSTAGATADGTALSYKRTERATVQVDLATTGAGTSTVIVKGSNALTSTGTYVNLETVTLTSTGGAASSSTSVSITGPYRFVKTDCTAIGTTEAGTTAAATIVTQGAGY